MVLGQGGTSTGIEEQNEQYDEEVSVTSAWGADHTIGTGNSYLEDPLQPIEDLQEATDGDSNDGGFANPASWFVGTSDPDGDGATEETAAGHEADLPDPDPSPSPSPDNSDGSDTVTPSQEGLRDLLRSYSPSPSAGGNESMGGQSSMMTVVAVVVAAVAAVVALAGGASADG